MDSQIVIIVVVVAAVVWLISRWYYQRKEGFAPMDPDTFNIPNYMTLERNIPIRKNVQIEEKVCGTENINQQGAPLEEVIKEEVKLTKPIQHMSQELQEILRNEERKLQELNTQYGQQVPELQYNKIMTPELLQAEMEQKMRHMEVEEKIKSEVIPETEFRHAEIVPEYNESKLVQELPAEPKEQVLTQELMPGMEQKQLLEEKLSKVLGEQVIVDMKTENNNLALAILLSVLLVGFIYQTRD